MAKRVDPGGVRRDSDGFWSKVLVITIVVIWVSLVAGNWAGKIAIERGMFSKKKSQAGTQGQSTAEGRPTFTRTPVAPPPTTDTPTPEESSSTSLPSPSESPSTHATVIVVPPTPSVSPSTESSPSPEATASESPSPVASVSPSASVTPEATSCTLQMGVFGSESNARKMADGLKSKDYSVDILPQGSGADQKWSVRVGHFDSREDAAAQADKLKSQGYSAIPVPR